MRPAVRPPSPRLLVGLVATDPYERAVAARALVRAGIDVRACGCLSDLVELLEGDRAVDVAMVDASDTGAARLVTALSTARPDLPFVAYDRRERLEDAIAEVVLRTRR